MAYPAVDAISDNLGTAAGVVTEDRNTTSHGLKHGVREALSRAWEDREVRGSVHRPDVAPVAEETDMRLKALGAHRGLNLESPFAIAGKDKKDIVPPGPQASQGVDNHQVTFALLETSHHGHAKAFLGQAERAPRLASVARHVVHCIHAIDDRRDVRRIDAKANKLLTRLFGDRVDPPTGAIEEPAQPESRLRQVWADDLTMLAVQDGPQPAIAGGGDGIDQRAEVMRVYEIRLYAAQQAIEARDGPEGLAVLLPQSYHTLGSDELIGQDTATLQAADADLETTRSQLASDTDDDTLHATRIERDDDVQNP